MMDDRWEQDTLFLVFEEDFRFRQGEEPQDPPRQAEPATFFAEPSAAKSSGTRQRQVGAQFFSGVLGAFRAIGCMRHFIFSGPR